MTLFSLLESLFFMSLALSFFLVFLMVYHFKKRMDSLDRKNETLGDICKTLIKEIESVKEENVRGAIQQQQPSFIFESFDNQNPLEALFRQMKEAQVQPLDLKLYDNEILVDILVDDEEEEEEDTLEMVLGEIVEEEILLIQPSEPLEPIEPLEPLEPLDVLEAEAEESVFTESVLTEPDTKLSKKSLKKMSVQMLRELAIHDGLNVGTKMKKKELLSMFLVESGDMITI